MVYAELGDKNQALNWLEKGYQEQATKMAFLKIPSSTTCAPTRALPL